jgi:hypothetical protein
MQAMTAYKLPYLVENLCPQHMHSTSTWQKIYIHKRVGIKEQLWIASIPLIFSLPPSKPYTPVVS